MNKYFLTIFILAIGTITIFSALSFSYMNYSQGHICPIAVISGDDCPFINNISYAVHHLSGIRIFNQGLFSCFLSLILVFFVILFFIKKNIFVFNNFVWHSSILNNLKFSLSKNRLQFLRWLSMHNKQDPEFLWAYGKS